MTTSGTLCNTLGIALAAAIIGAAAGCASTQGSGGAQSGRFQFAVIGDTSYSKVAEQEFDRLMGALNRESLAFVAHVGDFQADPRPYQSNPDKVSMPCNDEITAKTQAIFQASSNPFIFTPGDNDWSDCHELKARRVDPLERLSKLRELFYPEGRSLGRRTISVENQSRDPQFSKFRENLAWTIGGIPFATLHIVGSNDNKGRIAAMDAEHAERTRANIAWMRKAFASARTSGSPGLVLITQANPGFETHWSPTLVGRYFRNFIGVKPPAKPAPSGYDDFLIALAGEMENYKRPVLYVHGDTHIFHVSKPLMSRKTRRLFDNFTRVETFGDPDSHWVRITVDPSKEALFLVEPEIVAGNRAN